MTPSGFNIGTTLKTSRERKEEASWLEPVKKSSMPDMTHDAFTSPGCTRALVVVDWEEEEDIDAD